jgi:hypothetical protein
MVRMKERILRSLVLDVVDQLQNAFDRRHQSALAVEAKNKSG